MENVAISAVATLISRGVTYPLDTLKTMAQNTTGNTSYLQLFKSAHLFKGLSVTLLFSVPASTIYLTSYDMSKQYLVDNGFHKDEFLVHTIGAISAESISGLIFTPMEVIKQKLQVDASCTLNAKKLFKDIYANNGVKGFYRGYWLTQLVFIPYTITYFTTYERLKSYLSSQSKLEFTSYLFAASVSAAIAGMVSTPMDVIKTRTQIKGEKSAWYVAKELYKEGGIRSFTKGMGARIAWVAPSMSLTIAIWETLKTYYTT